MRFLLIALVLPWWAACGEAQGPAREPTYDGRSAATWGRDLRGDVLAGTSKTIEQLGAGGMDAVPVLAALIRSGRDTEDIVLAQGVARAVSQLTGPDVLDSLARAAPGDADAALILRMVEHSLDELETALIRSMTDRDARIRVQAVEGLGRLGRSARGARAALEAAQHDSDENVRKAAAEALDALRRRGR